MGAGKGEEDWTPEEIKDVVETTGLRLIGRKCFGGLDGTKNTGRRMKDSIVAPVYFVLVGEW